MGRRRGFAEEAWLAAFGLARAASWVGVETAIARQAGRLAMLRSGERNAPVFAALGGRDAVGEPVSLGRDLVGQRIGGAGGCACGRRFGVAAGK